MSLLMVTTYFESHRGGLELIGGHLVRELLHLGEDVRWLASDVTAPPDDPELAGRAIAVRAFNITERRFGIPFPLPSASAIWRIARQVRGSDAVMLQDSIYPMCIAAFLVARMSRVPVIIAQHVGIVPYRNRLLRLLMQLLNRIVARRMLTRADRVAFFSEITERYFGKLRRPVPAALMFTGVDTNLFHPALETERPARRRQLGLPIDRPIVLFVGRFVEKKGLPILSLMARQRPDIQWVFSGGGHLDPGEWCLPNVSVFRGRANTEMVPLYQASDVFVLPSKGEGFPLVIQEALACGLPVVCSADTAEGDRAATPYLSPVVLDEQHPDETAAGFCREIDRQIAGGGGADLRAERARFVAQQYSWSACGTGYQKLIRAAIEDHRRRYAQRSERGTKVGRA